MVKPVDFQVLNKVKNALLTMQRFEWEQGTTAQAFLEWGENDLVVQFAKSAIMRTVKDGRLGVMGKSSGSVTDPCSIGEALLFSYEYTGDEQFKTAANKLLDYILYRGCRTRDGILHHYDTTNQVWVDAYYMAPPFLAKAGHFDEAMKQIMGFRKYLFDEKKCLLSHIYDEDLNELTRNVFWGVGNGWAVAGLSRVIATTPEDRKDDKAYLIDYVTKLIDGCLAHQREDGLLHDIIDDPASFVDTNVSQMVAYAIYRGVTVGYLDKSYAARAEKARAAAYSKVDPYGFVTEVCGLPNFQTSSLAPEGQAFFILMEAAAHALKGVTNG